MDAAPSVRGNRKKSRIILEQPHNALNRSISRGNVMTLNQELDFATLESKIRMTFAGNVAHKTLLKAGHELYKFTQQPLIGDHGVTPWWSSVEPLSSDDTGLAVLLERSSNLGVTASQFSRACNAVTRQWNSMSGLLVTVIQIPVYAFVGRVAHQRFDEGADYRNVFLIGGATQLWIPNLTPAYIRQK